MTESSPTGVRLPCPNCRRKGEDESGDNLVMYDDGHGHCFACDHSHQPSNGDVMTDDFDDEPVEVFVPERGESVALSVRGISEPVCRKYAYEKVVQGDTTWQVANYFKNGSIVGQKWRGPGKKFFVKGKIDRDIPLYGQHLWSGKGRRIVVTEGEIDCLSVAELDGGKWPVVSLPLGAGNATRSIKANYEFLMGYDEVVLAFDADEEGSKAARACAALLPVGKAKIAEFSRKDPNEYLKAGEWSALKDALWQAQSYSPDGIIHVSDVVRRPQADQRIWPFPWATLTKALMGQRSGEMTMWTSGTGMGKSTVIRENTWFHLMNGRRVGLMMLEESCQETLWDLVSLKIGKPLRQIMAARKLNEQFAAQGLEAMDFGLTDNVTDEEVKEAILDLQTMGLYFHDHGGSREFDNVSRKIEYMAIACECEVVVLDHISVVVAAMSSGNERKDIDSLMGELRSTVERTEVHLDLVSQLRKADGKPYEEGGRITSQDLRGSGSLASVPNNIIAVERNQQHHDPLIANTTIIRSLKSRFNGQTGVIGALRYDRDSARMAEVPYRMDEDGNVCFGTAGAQDFE